MQSEQFIGPGEAASRLGISPKALRLYEQRGLIKPVRSEAGWRAYGSAEMARLGEIAALRALGLSLAQVERLLRGDGAGLEPALAAHQGTLEGELKRLAKSVETVRAIRDDLVAGKPLPVAELVRLTQPAGELVAAFELPWPWGGERFELRDLRPVTYIVGPLGSGKTRFAMRLAEVLPNACFLALDRDPAAARAAIAADAGLAARVQTAIDWLADEGAEVSDALIALLAGVCADGFGTIVVDMVEQGLDHATQEAVGALSPWSRPSRPHAVPDDALVGAARSQRPRPARGDYSLPRQPQPADPRSPLPRRSGLRNGRQLPCGARGPGAHGGRDRHAANCGAVAGATSRNNTRRTLR